MKTTEVESPSRDTRHKEVSELSPTKKHPIPKELESTIKRRGKENLHNPQHLNHLYTDLKLSTRQIAKLTGVHSKNAVTYWLLKHNIAIRDDLTATILANRKYPRHPFTGNNQEKSYMLGLRAGDLNAQRNSCLTIKARLATTHPAMKTLMENTFTKYGTVYALPYFNRYSQKFEWDILVWLDNSFEFLIKKSTCIPKWIIRNTGNFLSFLAGYFDAEGTVVLTQYKNRPSFSLTVATHDKNILRDAFQALKNMGLHPRMRIHMLKGTRTCYGPQNADCWALALYRRAEILHLADHLPLRHPEKIRRLALLVKTFRNKRLCEVQWKDIAPDIRHLRHQIDEEVKTFAAQAKQLRLKRQE